MSHQHMGNRYSGFRNLIPWIFLGIILFFLLVEHRAHLYGVLPYLLLLACPLMHLFHGHGGHGGHGQHHENDDGNMKRKHSGGCCGGGSDEENSRTGEEKP